DHRAHPFGGRCRARLLRSADPHPFPVARSATRTEMMMNSRGVYLLGGTQTDFRRNLAAEGVEDAVFALIREAAVGAIEDADIAASDVQRAHVGNHSSEIFTGQSHLGAMVPAVMEEWRDLPSSR